MGVGDFVAPVSIVADMLMTFGRYLKDSGTMSKFSKKKQARLDFLEGEYKKLLKITKICDYAAYKSDIADTVHFGRIMKIVYGVEK